MDKKEKETKIDKRLKKYLPFFAGLAVLALLFIVLYYAFQGFGKIEYQGLTFTKQKFGEILVYSYNYFVENSEGKIIQNTLYVRTDPRKNNIPVNGTIIYPKGKTVLISINDSGLTECENSMIAISTITNFIVANGIAVKGGVPDKNKSQEKNLTYITCEKYPNNMVIMIESSETTKIEKKDDGEFCYYIEVANCEIQEAVEKFAVQSIIDSKKDIN